MTVAEGYVAPDRRTSGGGMAHSGNTFTPPEGEAWVGGGARR